MIINLSPYEKDRIIKEDFGRTEMGRDLLAQDYMLKQITASLIYPKDNLGKKFWDQVYKKAYQQFGTTNIPVNTFNKVWIMPDGADVYEKGNIAYVYKSHLKVMLEEDCVSMVKHIDVGAGRWPALNPDKGLPLQAQERSSPADLPSANQSAGVNPTDKKTNKLGSQIVREIILPALEKEVNQGKNFAMLRQMYSGMIFATWYKQTLKESLLSKIYTDKSKVKGVDQDPKNNEEIYRQYLKAFKKGVFNFIKEDVDKYTNETIPRKYFSGGFHKVITLGHHSGADPEAIQEAFKQYGNGEKFDILYSALDESRAMTTQVGLPKIPGNIVHDALKGDFKNPKLEEILIRIFNHEISIKDAATQYAGIFSVEPVVQLIQEKVKLVNHFNASKNPQVVQASQPKPSETTEQEPLPVGAINFSENSTIDINALLNKPFYKNSIGLKDFLLGQRNIFWAVDELIHRILPIGYLDGFDRQDKEDYPLNYVIALAFWSKYHLNAAGFKYVLEGSKIDPKDKDYNLTKVHLLDGFSLTKADIQGMSKDRDLLIKIYHSLKKYNSTATTEAEKQEIKTEIDTLIAQLYKFQPNQPAQVEPKPTGDVLLSDNQQPPKNKPKKVAEISVINEQRILIKSQSDGQYKNYEQQEVLKAFGKLLKSVSSKGKSTLKTKTEIEAALMLLIQDVFGGISSKNNAWNIENNKDFISWINQLVEIIELAAKEKKGMALFSKKLLIRNQQKVLIPFLSGKESYDPKVVLDELKSLMKAVSPSGKIKTDSNVGFVLMSLAEEQSNNTISYNPKTKQWKVNNNATFIAWLIEKEQLISSTLKNRAMILDPDRRSPHRYEYNLFQGPNGWDLETLMERLGDKYDLDAFKKTLDSKIKFYLSQNIVPKVYNNDIFFNEESKFNFRIDDNQGGKFLTVFANHILATILYEQNSYLRSYQEIAFILKFLMDDIPAKNFANAQKEYLKINPIASLSPEQRVRTIRAILKRLETNDSQSLFKGIPPYLFLGISEDTYETNAVANQLAQGVSIYGKRIPLKVVNTKVVTDTNRTTNIGVRFRFEDTQHWNIIPKHRQELVIGVKKALNKMLVENQAMTVRGTLQSLALSLLVFGSTKIYSPPQSLDNVSLFGKPLTTLVADKDVGGINFNSAHLKLQIKRDGKGVPLPVNQQNLENIHIDGLIPIILDIKSAVNSPLLSELTMSTTQSLVKP